MLASIGVVIIIVLYVAYFYLKCSVLTSFATVAAAVFSLVLAFNYYEPVADMLISRGRGGEWAQAGCFASLFIVAFVLIRTCADTVVGANIEFGSVITSLTAVISGAITGILVSGVLLLTVGMAPTSPKLPYSRFASEGALSLSDLSSPKKSLLNTDGIVTNLFSWISNGSLSNDKNFDVYHADFIDQLHVNNFKLSEGVNAIVSKDAVIIPKAGVRRRDIDNRMIVRIGIKGNSIEDGGAKSKDGELSFTPSQIRLVCTRGDKVVTIYPKEYIIKGKPKQEVSNLAEAIIISPRELEILEQYGRGVWVDLAFEVGKGMKTEFLQFKTNALVEVPKPVTGEESEEKVGQ